LAKRRSLFLLLILMQNSALPRAERGQLETQNYRFAQS
jgi:hypothetical protein